MAGSDAPSNAAMPRDKTILLPDPGDQLSNFITGNRKKKASVCGVEYRREELIAFDPIDLRPNSLSYNVHDHHNVHGSKPTRIIHPYRIPPQLDRVAVPGHAALILVDEGLAVVGRVGGLGEEHALVALGLFFLAHAARLERVSMSASRGHSRVSRGREEREGGRGGWRWRTLGLEALSDVGAGAAAGASGERLVSDGEQQDRSRDGRGYARGGAAADVMLFGTDWEEPMVQGRLGDVTDRVGVIARKLAAGIGGEILLSIATGG